MMRTRLDGLTGIRFLAAALVFAHHSLSPSLVRGGLADVPLVSDVARMGFVGVTFFFVLSGFVLTWSWDERRDATGFYGRRFARVWPLHAATYLAAALLVLPLAGREVPGSIAACLGLLLLQAWAFDPHVFFGGNAASWSLSCEAFFYASLPALYPRLADKGRRAAIVTVGTCVSVLAVLPLLVRALSSRHDLTLSLCVFPLYRFPEFLIGVILGCAVRRGWRPAWGMQHAAVLVVGALLLATWVLKGFVNAPVRDDRALVNIYGNLILLLPFAALIAAVAAADLAERSTWLTSRPLVVLGEASFALYLVHSAVIVLVAQAGYGRRFLHGVPLTGLALVISVVCAWLLHRGVERPIEARLRARLAAREGKAPPALVR